MKTVNAKCFEQYLCNSQVYIELLSYRQYNLKYYARVPFCEQYKGKIIDLIINLI